MQGKAKLLQEATFYGFHRHIETQQVLVVEYSASLSHVINFSYLNNMALAERKKQAQRQKKALSDHSYIT